MAAVWGTGLYFGNALSQNASGDLIGHVLDASADDATPRMYRSNLELRPHNDITAMASLACCHKQLGVPFTDEEIEAMNAFDRIATAPENRLAFFLERGEMIVMNNYTVMHARTSFTNFPEVERKRHLVRLWMDAEGFRQVPASFNLHAGSNGVPRQEGKRGSLDFKQLYKDDPVAMGGVADLRVSDEMAAGAAR